MILGFSIDTFFTVVITIVIFSLGLLISRKNEQCKEYKRLKDLEKYFYALLDILTAAVTRQIRAFEALVQQIKEETHQDFTIQIISDLNIGDVNRISQEDLFKIFITNKNENTDLKVKYFKEITKGLNIIKLVNESWKFDFREFLNTLKGYERQFYDNAELIGDFIDDMVSAANRTNYRRGIDPYLDQFNEIINLWERLDNRRGVYIMFKYLIRPLYKLCQDYPQDERNRQLLSPVTRCFYAFANYKNISSVYDKQLSEYIKNLRDANDTIEVNIEQFKQIKDIKPKWYKL